MFYYFKKWQRRDRITNLKFPPLTAKLHPVERKLQVGNHCSKINTNLILKKISVKQHNKNNNSFKDAVKKEFIVVAAVHRENYYKLWFLHWIKSEPNKIYFRDIHFYSINEISFLNFTTMFLFLSCYFFLWFQCTVFAYQRF